MFLHSQLFLFEVNIKKETKTGNISTVEIKAILVNTQQSLLERKEANFIGTQTKQIFITQPLNTLKWSQPFKKYNVFDCMMTFYKNVDVHLTTHK